ncbi:MAG TPA: CHASE domain-containing protein [Geobacteraceae bacterium]
MAGRRWEMGRCAGKLRYYFAPAAVVIVGALLSVIAFCALREQDHRVIELEFQREAQNHVAALEREMEFNLQVIVSLQAFLGHSEVVRTEFQRYVTPFLLRNKSIQALEWIPRVPGAERGAYETGARREGSPAFRFCERTAQGKMTRAFTRPEYFPVYYLVPYKGNEIALGFDLASDPIRREALDSSRDTGKMLATQRVTLVQERESQYGFLVFAPVYRKGGATDTVQERRRTLKGFALGVFRVGDILEKSLTYLNPAGIDIYLYDRAGPGRESLLCYHPSRVRPASSAMAGDPGDRDEGSLEYAKNMNFAGREWQVVCRAAPGFAAGKGSGRPLVVLEMGILFSVLFAVYLKGHIRRSEDVRRMNEELEQKAQERTVELLEAQEELVRREKLAILGQLSGSVSHELRNPLGVMSNAVYFLKTVLADADETTREYLDILKKEIDNSQRIIGDLLDFTRTRQPLTTAVTPRELVDASLGRCAMPKSITPRTEVPDNLPQLMVDPQQMEQVLQNLIANAVQAMPEGGSLSIGARADGDYVEISVADTGAGISPENMKKLFQPLFTTKARGIGLGLVVCRNLATANGGRIEVESRPGGGTTFTLVSPAGRGDETANDATAGELF